MKNYVVVNAPMEPRTFPVSTEINGVPCIRVCTMDMNHLPSETIKVFCAAGGAAKEHNTSEGLVQEVCVGDYIGVCAKQSPNSPQTLNSLYITEIREGLVITVNAIL